jgi:hypothetical protein
MKRYRVLMSTMIIFMNIEYYKCLGTYQEPLRAFSHLLTVIRSYVNHKTTTITVTGATTLQKIQNFSDTRNLGGETVLSIEKKGQLKIALYRRRLEGKYEGRVGGREGTTYSDGRGR